MRGEPEGFIDVPGGRVWYRVAGADRAGVPLFGLHGGPGFTHDTLLTLNGLASDRPVVLYDQLGSGRSDRPVDLGFCRVDRFVEEVGSVRESLGLDRIHLLGHSWGGTLALSYALTGPAGLESLILASPLVSTSRWLEDARRLRSKLPEDVQRVLADHEERGFTGCPEYVAATYEFYRRHLCRLSPWPEELERGFAEMSTDVYESMWGPTEFHCTGGLVELDLAPRLGELRMPVLFTCGRHDEATPDTVASFRNAVPGAELAVFEESSHSAHLEETERYLDVVRVFLQSAEAPTIFEGGENARG
jgi:proline iminopeptidase